MGTLLVSVDNLRMGEFILRMGRLEMAGIGTAYVFGNRVVGYFFNGSMTFPAGDIPMNTVSEKMLIYIVVESFAAFVDSA